MKLIATIYTLALGGIALWALGVQLYYEGTAREHLLPGVVLQFATLPSSLLMEYIAELTPWVLSHPVAMLSLMTGLGGLQATLVWLVAIRFKFPGA